MNTAALILLLVKCWAIIGGAVALLFLTIGIGRLDEDAQDAYVFRPLLIPGILVLWPLVLWRWYILADGKDEWAARYKPKRQNHRWFGYAMPLAVVVIIALGLSVRQQWPGDIAPVQIAPAEAQE